MAEKSKARTLAVGKKKAIKSRTDGLRKASMVLICTTCPVVTAPAPPLFEVTPLPSRSVHFVIPS